MGVIMNLPLKKLFLILSLAIFLVAPESSYSALVSDNDGAAFVTPAEFDSLRNQFSQQINTMLSDIDSKIDNSINQYLTGIKIAKTTTLSLPLQSWDTVTGLNYDLGNTWQPLDFNLTYNWYQNAHITSSWRQVHWGFAQIDRTRDATTYQPVNLCDAGSESATNPDYVVWEGHAADYRDKVVGAIAVNTYAIDHADSWDGKNGIWVNGSNSVQFSLCNWAKLNTGYYSTFINNANSIWGVRWYIYAAAATTYSWYATVTNYLSRTFSTSIELRENADDEKVTHEHIMHYKKLSNLYLCDKDWKGHLTANPVKTRNDLSYDTQSSLWAASERHYVDSLQTKITTPRTMTAYYRGDYGVNNDTAKIPTIGLVGKTYSSSTIRQMTATWSQVIDGNTYKTENIPVLSDGLAVFAGKRGDKIEWEPVFKNTKAGSSLTTITSQNYELEVMLSAAPFGDEFSSSNIITWVDDDGNTKNTATTVDKKCKIKFTMPRTGVVYCKWRPASTSIRSSLWSADIDLTNCGTYKLTYADS